MSTQPSPQRPRNGIWSFVKWSVLLVVLVFVVRRAVQLWLSAPTTPIRIRAGWLVLAGVAYLIGWLPSVWFWRALIQAAHQPVGWRDAIRAYYVGHLGKYVPGKALVLVIRGSMLKEAGVNPVFAGTAAAYETLVFMATGFSLGIAAAPSVFGEEFWSRLPTQLVWLRDKPALFAAIILAATFATTPISSWLFTQMGRKTMSWDESHASPPPSISSSLIAKGVFMTSVGWAFHSFSLGCVIQAIADQPFDMTYFPVWLVATTVSTVGGFVVLVAPGGIGVREGLLIELLKNQEHLGPSLAIVVAGLLRAVWFATELGAAAVLYFAKKRSQ
jgi:glycosyltransferase 2 family protein